MYGKSEYRPSVADKLLAEELEGMGAVLKKGPKLCGKNSNCKAAG